MWCYFFSSLFHFSLFVVFLAAFFLPVISISFHLCVIFFFCLLPKKKICILTTCWPNCFVSQSYYRFVTVLQCIKYTAAAKERWTLRGESSLSFWTDAHESVNTDQMFVIVPITSVIVKSILINYHTIFLQKIMLIKSNRFYFLNKFTQKLNCLFMANK